MRIGELSRRTGVSPELLRAWEQRYGLLRPSRSPGGFRLYSSDDEARVRRTTALIGQGLSAAEAARLAADPVEHQEGTTTRLLVDEISEELRRALDRFDGKAAHAALDRLFNTFSIEYSLLDVLVPYLHDLGERWAEGTLTVAQEHFASHLIRGRLLGIAGDWGAAGPSSAVLACLPGEAHDLGLVFLGILLARRGWRVTFLGADTPFETLGTTVETLDPTVVVLATVDAALVRAHADAIADLATSTAVAVAAPVDSETLSSLGAALLVGTLDEAADSLASSGLRAAGSVTSAAHPTHVPS
jgi:MerR family transcriptional regulator, light-induced transcriptional regulator